MCVGCSRRRVHARVLQQVVDDLAQASGVARDDRGSVEVGVEDAVGVDRTGRVDRVRDDRREVDRLALERSALVEPSEQQEVVDEHAHALRLRFDARHRPGEVVGPRVGAAAEQLRVAPDRRDRRPQLVRGVADEPPQALLRGAALVERRLDLGQHRVERGAELADLGVVVGGLHPARQVAGRDRAGGLAHRLERPQPDLHEHECERAGDERDPDRDQRFDREQPSERGAHLGERHRDHEGSGARARPHRLDPEAAAPARGARGERHRADAAGRRPGEAGGQHGDGARCPGGTRTSGSARRCPRHRAAPRSSRSGTPPGTGCGSSGIGNPPSRFERRTAASVTCAICSSTRWSSDDDSARYVTTSAISSPSVTSPTVTSSNRARSDTQDAFGGRSTYPTPRTVCSRRGSPSLRRR